MLRPIVRFISIALFFLIFQPAVSHGFTWGNKELVTINDQTYSVEDFRHWWQNWNEKGDLPFPEKPDEFIDFHLVAQQGLAMGLDKKPQYLHKIDVFKKVRGMMALKGEEVDSKIKLDEPALRKYFEDHYSPVRLVQILTFRDAELAQQAYEKMLPFQGQKAGRIIFADLQGGDIDSRSDRYDELWLSPEDFRSNKKEDWLKVVEKTPLNEVSPPFLFAENHKYLLFRVADQKPADQSLLMKKAQRIKADLYKEERDRLTGMLLAKLIKKYEVEVDNDLLGQISLEEKYDEEFLQKPLINIKDQTYTVSDVLYNMNRESQTRRGMDSKFIKNMVVGNIINQSVIEAESLARGYENKPPWKWAFDFYRQNRLGAEVGMQLKESITVSDDDVEAYYQANLEAYSQPETTKYLFVEGEKETLNKIWIGALQGGDLEELAQKYALSATSKTENREQLSPVLASELDKLQKGGVSSPFLLGDRYALVKFLDRTPGRVHPLAEVKNKLKDLVMKQKFDAVRAEYLNKLKSRSEIEINWSNWQDLVREYTNEINK